MTDTSHPTSDRLERDNAVLDPNTTLDIPDRPTFDETLERFDCSICGKQFYAEHWIKDAQCADCFASSRVEFEALSPDEGALFTARLDQYQILKQLGSGGTAVVFLAQRRTDQHPVAIKVMHPSLFFHPRSRERFTRQVKAHLHLTHPRILERLDQGSVEQDELLRLQSFLTSEQWQDWKLWPKRTLFLVTEVCPGGSLAELVKLDYPSGLPISLGLRLGLQALEGLVCAHALTIRHRDIKPANLLLMEREDQVKIADFGLVTADAITELRTKSTGQHIQGTLNFLVSPLSHTPSDDVWSMGATLFYLFTGKTPRELRPGYTEVEQYQSAPILRIEMLRPDLPSAICEVIQRALDRDITGRYPSALEMRDALIHAAQVSGGNAP